tara:strand:- start:2901 stop:3008 length:108 start_codon:yes stop_codon:yes gene_type:complete
VGLGRWLSAVLGDFSHYVIALLVEGRLRRIRLVEW